jgi:hypothetical protein
MRGVRFASAFSRISGIASFSLAGVFAKVMPRSSRKARNWLITDVRRAMSRSRTRWMACKSSWSSVLIGTKRMFCRSTASAIASASRKSFFVGLHERLHELRWDQLHIMALSS